MKNPRYHVPLDDAELSEGFDRIRAAFDVPLDHSPAALAEAEAAAARGPTLPPQAAGDWIDARHLEFVAIDPPGARDLDQIFTAERRGSGYRIHYAIADVGAWVTPGGAIDTEALERGVTLYAPDRKASLHPDAINEAAGSLLPGVDRPALLWTIDLDDRGDVESATACRAMVHNREALTYRAAQHEIDTEPRESLRLLSEIGRLRELQEIERGAVSLSLPDQEVYRDEHGHAQLTFDVPLPVENWNAQVSLLTGTLAARMMVDAGVGLLRTLPEADEQTIDELRRTARHLAVDWPDDQTYADRVRSLDPSDAPQAALLMRSARGLRGAGYAAFTQADELPDDHQHSAIGDIYSHVTAPLRRVCDRFANEVLISLCADVEIPEWVLATLPSLPKTMGRTRQRARSIERAIIDFMEAVMLAPAIGHEFEAMVVNHRHETAVIQLRDPAVVASLTPKRPLGEELTVKLVDVDLATRHATFERVLTSER